MLKSTESWVLKDESWVYMGFQRPPLKDTSIIKEDGQDSNILSNAEVLGSIQQCYFDSYLTKQL